MNETFTQLQPYLFSIAYRMLGSVMDAEDMVQETFLRWQKIDASAIEQPKAFLAKILTRLSIDHLRSAKVTRETYIGPWLPEPLLTGEVKSSEAILLLADSLSIAFLKLLEQLNPTERAVFLLRHVFDYEYREIAEIVEKTEAACRQTYRRAKQHLINQQPRYDTDWDAQQAMMFDFWQACADNDAATLKTLLAEEVVMWSDGGGKVTAARKPVVAQDKVITFLFGIMRLAPEQYEVKTAVINGQPAAQILVNGQLISVMVLDIWNGRIQNIYAILNPDKLQHLQTVGSG